MGGDQGVHSFPCGIIPKLHVIMRLEFELALYNVVVQLVSHYTTRTTPLTSFTIRIDLSEIKIQFLKNEVSTWQVMRETILFSLFFFFFTLLLQSRNVLFQLNNWSFHRQALNNRSFLLRWNKSPVFRGSTSYSCLILNKVIGCQCYFGCCYFTIIKMVLFQYFWSIISLS